MKENTEKAMAVQEIMFDGDPISVMEKDGAYFIPMKPICEVLGVDWEAQRQMINRDPVLNSVACIIQATGSDGKQYEMISLPLSYLNGWLFKIDAGRYEGERQEKIIRYQKECYEVLFKHFFKQFRTVTEEMKARLAYMQHELKTATLIQRTGAAVRKGFKQILAGEELLSDYAETPGIQQRIKQRLDERLSGLMADRMETGLDPALLDMLLNEFLKKPKQSASLYRVKPEFRNGKLSKEGEWIQKPDMVSFMLTTRDLHSVLLMMKDVLGIDYQCPSPRSLGFRLSKAVPFFAENGWRFKREIKKSGGYGIHQFTKEIPDLEDIETIGEA